MKDMGLLFIRSMMIAVLFGLPIFNLFKEVHMGLAGFLACTVAILISQTSIFGFAGKEVKTNSHKAEHTKSNASAKPDTVFDDMLETPSQNSVICVDLPEQSQKTEPKFVEAYSFRDKRN